MPLSTFPDVPCVSSFLHSDCWKCKWSQLYMSPKNSPPCSFQVILSSALDNFFTCMCWPVFSWRFKRNALQVSGVLPLCSSILSMQLFSLWYFALWILAILASLNPQLHLFNLGRTSSSIWIPYPCLSSGVSWGNCRTHLICFPSLRVYFSVLLDVQCLKVIFSIYFVYL